MITQIHPFENNESMMRDVIMHDFDFPTISIIDRDLGNITASPYALHLHFISQVINAVNKDAFMKYLLKKYIG